jgi:predicted DCC family thiol-disulfide oxidoreductase YuxK
VLPGTAPPTSSVPLVTRRRYFGHMTLSVWSMPLGRCPAPKRALKFGHGRLHFRGQVGEVARAGTGDCGLCVRQGSLPPGDPQCSLLVRVVGYLPSFRLTQRPQHLSLVFDGTCGFCTRSVRLLKVLDRNRRVAVVPFQKPGIPASVGLTLEECEATVWAIAPDGRRYRGAEAVNASVAAALGTAVPLLLYYLPGIRQLQDFIYSVVASNRSRLPGDRPYCAQFPAECR